ncbi:MAG: septal ring lytic transglycosylase RlpA family protein [Gammaproteobacteria bacterium]|nr:septal ring lytic transglycosylase RlpA family protein [Gammaproteobacteria bacterium]
MSRPASLPVPDRPPPVDTERDSAPLVVPPGLEQLPDPEPRWEPLSRSGNRSPYMVFGETYHLLPTAEGYREQGIASWYGQKFDGRPTASGEPYDMFELTAAHRKLPLPTYARVTNLENGRSTIVKINDRGPFHADRIIDLSFGAAVKLGFADAGVARVEVEAITLDDGPPLRLDQPILASTLTEGHGAIWLQAGAFGNPDSAAALKQRLADVIGERSDAATVQLLRGADALTRVRVGPLPDLIEASRLQALITFANLGTVPLIVRDQ